MHAPRGKALRVAHVLQGLNCSNGGCPKIRALQLVAKDHQPLCIRKRKRPQQPAFHNREDRSRRANPQRECKNGRQRKPRRVPELPHCITQILHHLDLSCFRSAIPFSALASAQSMLPVAQESMWPAQPPQTSPQWLPQNLSHQTVTIGKASRAVGASPAASVEFPQPVLREV